VRRLLGEIASFRDAPVWTPETIAEATAEWFAMLSGKAR
jgi:hypothetical protein